MKKLLMGLLGLLLVVSFSVPKVTTAAPTALGWEKVSEDGLGSSDFNMSYPLTTYKDNLIVAAGNASSGDAKVYKSTDGTTFTQVNEDGFGSNVDAVYDFAKLNGYLYALAYDFSVGTSVWRTNDLATWENIGDDPTGDGTDVEPAQMAILGNDLYVSFQNGATSKAFVLKSVGGEDNWSTSFAQAQIPMTNYVSSLASYNDQLYFAVGDTNDGSRIYRSSNGSDWQWIIGGGIDDANNSMLWLFEMNDVMWAGSSQTFSMPNLHYSTGGEWIEVALPDEIDAQTSAIIPIEGHDGWNYFTTYSSDGVNMDSQIWRYKNGTWEEYTEMDFGDSSNWALIGPIYYNGYMYVGTGNDDEGGSVWRRYIGTGAGVSSTATTTTTTTTAAELPETGPK